MSIIDRARQLRATIVSLAENLTDEQALDNTELLQSGYLVKLM